MPLAGPATPALSVAAGLPISYFKAALSPDAPVIRAMPNTPAAIGQGVTALIANELINEGQRRLGEALASVVGDVVWLDSEAQMDAVTAVSGSGPAYVFHMIEALAEAGRAEGLPDALERVGQLGGDEVGAVGEDRALGVVARSAEREDLALRDHLVELALEVPHGESGRCAEHERFRRGP